MLCDRCGGSWEEYLIDAEENSGISALQVVELIDGVLVGALETEHVDSLETCIKDIDPLVTHM